jgi:hypothetical protein
LEAVYDGAVVDADVEHSSIGVQEGGDVLHDYGGDVVGDYVSVIFELDVPAFDYWYFLSEVEVLILGVPILLSFAFAGLGQLGGCGDQREGRLNF